MVPGCAGTPAPARWLVLCSVPEGKQAVGCGEQLCLQEGKWGLWDGAGQGKNHH